jgi:dTDP-L-rhamnose 4-epimerase
MKVLIIGGTRFLGAAVARELLGLNYKVTALHRGKTSGKNLSGLKHLLGDARDKNFVERQLREGCYDVVVDTILRAKDLVWYLPLLANSTGKLVHCGSAGVYTPARCLPSLETDSTPCPRFLGDFDAKLAQDHVLLNFNMRTGFHTCSLRVSNLIGPGDIPLDIWGGRKSTYFQRLADHMPIWIPNNGSSLLQPVHVDDVASGFRAAIESDRTSGQIYNLSSEAPVTLIEYAQCAKDLLGSKSEFSFVSKEIISAKIKTNNSGPKFWHRLFLRDKSQQDGLHFLCEDMWVSIDKAKHELGYMPKISLGESLRDSFDWMIQKDLLRLNL